ncbi:lectin-like [Scyliorhinus canicula]|uniref:lectin-like n=1 Tax=Scyliorhinus canicula TaxID=7830 RepID=UPI0018F55B54|nr:lectin-like [Scyliorhinus canicula]
MCADGVVKFRRCFMLISVAKTWADAEAHCQKLIAGSHLVSIHCKKQNDFIAANFKNGRVLRTWIGLNDIGKEGNYVWSNGTPTNYLMWRSRQPDNLGSIRNCVEMGHWGSNSWNDAHCSLKYPFICSHKLPCE